MILSELPMPFAFVAAMSDNALSGRDSGICLVACTKKKLSIAVEAAELYRASAWFRLARSYVEVQGLPWYILSDMHGLVAPGTVLDPYELSMRGMSLSQRRLWSDRVVTALDALGYDDATPVHILAGKLYRDPLADWLGSRAIIPMKNMRIGQQMRWLREQTLRSRRA